jgi:hypothetical protein
MKKETMRAVVFAAASLLALEAQALTVCDHLEQPSSISSRAWH